MVALIGRPTSEFVRRSETTEQCFDPSGKHTAFAFEVLLVPLQLWDYNTNKHVGAWIAYKDATIPLVSLESREKRLAGREKELFIQFMKSMLKWLPEQRKTARQLLEDPWLL